MKWLVFFLFFSMLSPHGNSQSGLVVTIELSGPPTTGETLNPEEEFCLDSTVLSFRIL